MFTILELKFKKRFSVLQKKRRMATWTREKSLPQVLPRVIYETLMAPLTDVSAYTRKIYFHSFMYLFIQQLLLEGSLYNLRDMRHSGDRKTKQKKVLPRGRSILVGERSLCSRSK